MEYVNEASIHYRKSELEELTALSGLKMQIHDREGNKTKWLDITEYELEAVRRVLLKLDC